MFQNKHDHIEQLQKLVQAPMMTTARISKIADGQRIRSSKHLKAQMSQNVLKHVPKSPLSGFKPEHQSLVHEGLKASVPSSPSNPHAAHLSDFRSQDYKMHQLLNH